MPTQKKVDGTVGMRSFTDDSLCLLDVSVGDSHGAPSIAITVSPSILPYAIFPSAWNRHHLVLIGPSFHEVALGRVLQSCSAFQLEPVSHIEAGKACFAKRTDLRQNRRPRFSRDSERLELAAPHVRSDVDRIVEGVRQDEPYRFCRTALLRRRACCDNGEKQR